MMLLMHYVTEMNALNFGSPKVIEFKLQLNNARWKTALWVDGGGIQYSTSCVKFRVNYASLDRRVYNHNGAV